jgi:hypothetical protein
VSYLKGGLAARAEPEFSRSKIRRADSLDTTTSASMYNLGNVVKASSAARSAAALDACAISITLTSYGEERAMSAVLSLHPLHTTATSISPAVVSWSNVSSKRFMTAASLCAGIATEPIGYDEIITLPESLVQAKSEAQARDCPPSQARLLALTRMHEARPHATRVDICRVHG